MGVCRGCSGQVEAPGFSPANSLLLNIGLQPRPGLKPDFLLIRIHRTEVRLRSTGASPASHQLGQPEVQNLTDTFVGDEDVGRLDVAMNDAPLVRGLQAIGDLQSDVQ